MIKNPFINNKRKLLSCCSMTIMTITIKVKVGGEDSNQETVRRVAQSDNKFTSQ